jgi:hypothetical protein
MQDRGGGVQAEIVVRLDARVRPPAPGLVLAYVHVSVKTVPKPSEASSGLAFGVAVK